MAIYPNYLRSVKLNTYNSLFFKRNNKKYEDLRGIFMGPGSIMFSFSHIRDSVFDFW
jgi:hypothetical protein